MAGKANYSIREYGTLGKSSRVGVFIPTLNAGNIAAQLGLVSDLRTAIQGVIVGELQVETVTAQETQVSTDIPTDVHAQRENKWHVKMTETGTGNDVSIEIPCADLDLLSSNGEDMDTASPEYTALVAALEAVALSNDGNAVTVNRVYFVGRSI